MDDARFRLAIRRLRGTASSVNASGRHGLGLGYTLDLGRAQRFPNNLQLAVLWRRDQGCAVPGCGRTRFLHAHHVVPWSHGGATSMDNLLLLCSSHHRGLHEGLFTIEALGEQQFTFRTATGTALTPAPEMYGDLDPLVTAQSHVDASTIEPDWNGEPLYHYAIHTHLLIWQQRLRDHRRHDAINDPGADAA